MNTNDRTIAYTILSQLGGNRFCAMIGVSSNTTIEGGLRTQFKAKAKNKANLLVVVLNGNDLYNVEFSRIWGHTWKSMSMFYDVPAENLVSLFETETGLATRF